MSADTSQEAFASVAPHVEGLRGRVLEFIDSRGAFGATDEEMQLQMPMPPNTQRPRRIELVDAGYIKDSGRSRVTRSGRFAIVWVGAHG